MVALFFAAAFTPLPNALNGALTAPGRLGPAQAIVVLGAGASDSFLADRSLRRAVDGVRLYHRGLAPLLVLLGPRQGQHASEAEIRRHLALDLGVPPDAILLADGRTTREEAEHCRRLLSPRGVRRVLLVTGFHHMPRARALFLGQGFDVLPAPVEEIAPETARPELRLGLTRSLAQEGMARLIYKLAGII